MGFRAFSSDHDLTEMRDRGLMGTAYAIESRKSNVFNVFLWENPGWGKADVVETKTVA